jgi:hypothetical protein
MMFLNDPTAEAVTPVCGRVVRPLITLIGAAVIIIGVVPSVLLDLADTLAVVLR